MATELLERNKEPWFRRLYLPSYRVVDAARYAKTHTNTVSSWFFGSHALLDDREKRKPLNYFQLVEVAFVSFFRRMGISMQRVRRARDYIAQNFTSEHPFAEYQFKTEGFHILMELVHQESLRDLERVIVTDQHGQLAWESILSDKFAEFDYEHELALRWHPNGRDSMVIIDPRIAFGAPMVMGLPTWVLKGRWVANESKEEMAVDFNLPIEAIDDAFAFEGIT